MRKKLVGLVALLSIVVFLFSFNYFSANKAAVIVLGIAQDAGYPQIACEKECCLHLKEFPRDAAYPTSIALIDYDQKKWWLVEASPNITEQLSLFRKLTQAEFPKLPEGILLTHAHIGHYAGLMFLGKEALGANKIKVYCLPRMKEFLETNGPWSQLVKEKNIVIQNILADQEFQLSASISVSLFQVPHRDEFSETAGMSISLDQREVLFIPDIDKWEKLKLPIDSLVRRSDLAFLDATFYSNGELANRDMSQIPHPFVLETMKLFAQESDTFKSKIHFIHFNHTNPLLWKDSLKTEFDKGPYQRSIQGKIYP